jgi:phosphoribosylformylglycinamidine (FGAM) synthase-like enzyme
MLTPSDVMASNCPWTERTAKRVSDAHGYDPYLAEQNPYLGGLYAVLSAVTNLSVREPISNDQTFFAGIF